MLPRNPGLEVNIEELRLAWPYLEVFLETFSGTKFCVAEKEYIGLCTDGTRPRDNVCVLLGGIAPVVLRKSNARDHHFRLASECYIHSIMKREAFESTDFNTVDLFLW
jgi:hypothetical protein